MLKTQNQRTDRERVLKIKEYILPVHPVAGTVYEHSQDIQSLLKCLVRPEFGKIFLKGLPVKMVQESRAQVNAAGGAGADRPAARRKKRRPCGKVRMPPSVITGRRGIPLRPGGMKKSVTSTGCGAPWPGRIPPYAHSGWQARPAAWRTGSCGSRAGPVRAGVRAA